MHAYIRSANLPIYGDEEIVRVLTKVNRKKYDGDTVSNKMLFTLEANEEAEKQLHEIKHYVTVNGELARVIGNESYLTFYNMTRRE